MNRNKSFQMKLLSFCKSQIINIHLYLITVMCWIIICCILYDILYPIYAEVNKETALLRKQNEAQYLLDRSTERNEQLQKLISRQFGQKELKKFENNILGDRSTNPNYQYEELLRELPIKVEALLNQFNKQMLGLALKIKVEDKKGKALKHFKFIQTMDYKENILADIQNLKSLDGFFEWRLQKTKAVNDFVKDA